MSVAYKSNVGDLALGVITKTDEADDGTHSGW